MSSKWIRVAILTIIVLMFAFTLSFAGCGDIEPPEEPLPEEPLPEPDDSGGGM